MSGKNNLIKQNITDTLEKNYMPYAMSVIVSRAIPEIDGFKPAHRKLLYTMYTMGLLKGNRVKSADVVGQTMRLNPHGDAPIYETLVRLAKDNETLIHPFIDSKGNFGKQTSRDMSYAASRYTEVKLDAICHEIFKNIDKDTVDFVDNYNNSMKEPVLFPTTFPNILVTPNLGIAVGMASNICSFNLKEVCNATINYMKNNDIDIGRYIKGPDFSTGGTLIFNEDDANKVYETGRGSFKIRGKYKFDKKNNCIDIYEIPYTTTIEAIIERVINLVKQGRVKEINDIRDETDRSGLKITIDLKKGIDPDLLMTKFFKMTTLEDNFNCNFNILIKGKPETLGIKGVLDNWIEFRISCIRRQINFDINKKSAYLHLLKGLEKIILDIDKAIKIIRETDKDKEVIPNLIYRFEIDEIQAEYIAEIKLRNLNKEYLLKKTSEMNNLEREINNFMDIINHDHKIKNIIAEDLKEVSKKHGQKRLTEIICETKVAVFEEESFIDDFPLKIFFTKDNYFKKISMASLRRASEQMLKDDDIIKQEIETTNKSEILFFSNKHVVYKMWSYDIPDCKASQLGEYLPNLLSMDEDEKIIYILATDNYDGNMIFGYSNGKFVKTPLKGYYTKVNRNKLINAYSDSSELIFIDYAKIDKNYLVIRGKDRGLLYSTGLLKPIKTRSAVGVQVFSLKKNSSVTKIFNIDEFISKDIEYYRSLKIPSAGHFLTKQDLKLNLK